MGTPPMAKTRPWARLVSAVLAAGGAGTPALAGAWVQEPGEGLVLVDASLHEAPRAFDAFGNAQPGPTFRETKVSVYAEHGLTERVTLVGRLERVDQSAADGIDGDAHVNADLAARFGVRLGPGLVSSLQIGVLSGEYGPWPRASGGGEPAEFLETRTAIGAGFGGDHAGGYVNLEAAGRLAFDGDQTGDTVAATVGVRRGPWSARADVAQDRRTAVDGQTDRAVRLGAAFGRRTSARSRLELGVGATVAGENTARETVLRLSLSRRY